ncbi:MAG: alpha-glucuronidase, partial [Bacteroidetes bacterium]
MKNTLLPFIFLFVFMADVVAEDGYRLWLRYDKIQNEVIRKDYMKKLKGFVTLGNSSTLDIASSELQYGLTGLLDESVNEKKGVYKNNMIILGKGKEALLKSLNLEENLAAAGKEGYVIFSGKLNRKKVIVIAGNEDVGVLYGVFHFLRLIQTHQNIENLLVVESPKLDVRMLNHWDNLDRTVERGYAGFSIWDWHKLPHFIPQRYHDYARANASIGINGTVLTNVNSNALVLRPDYIEKVKAVADVMRPYGIKVYLTARFSAPIELGKMETADPLLPEVKDWWKHKVDEI